MSYIQSKTFMPSDFGPIMHEQKYRYFNTWNADVIYKKPIIVY